MLQFISKETPSHFLCFSFFTPEGEVRRNDMVATDVGAIEKKPIKREDGTTDTLKVKQAYLL